jgi:hypothetical protein
VGLIGCVGRGNWIGAFFPEFAGYAGAETRRDTAGAITRKSQKK